jgi:hypothetical protein
LAPHHSYWYAVKSREFQHLGPCPDENQVLDAFDARRVRRFVL